LPLAKVPSNHQRGWSLLRLDQKAVRTSKAETDPLHFRSEIPREQFLDAVNGMTGQVWVACSCTEKATTRLGNLKSNLPDSVGNNEHGRGIVSQDPHHIRDDLLLQLGGAVRENPVRSIGNALWHHAIARRFEFVGAFGEITTFPAVQEQHLFELLGTLLIEPRQNGEESSNSISMYQKCRAV